MYKLKGCPICNAEVKLMFLNCETFEDNVWDESIGNVATWFKCYGCDSEFFHDEPIDIPEKQIEWWNTRKPMERISERLKRRSNPTLLLSPSWLCREERIMRFEGYRKGINEAIEIVKEEGELNE